MNENNVILIGFMGAGKTTVGSKLSDMLKKPFLDLDRYIEEEDGRKIDIIFEEDGEPYFRNLETKCLKKIIKESSNLIISVGGGLPLREENQKILKDMGIIIFLKVKPDTVLERIKNNKERPLLQGENVEEKVNFMLLERNPIYTKIADVIIDVDNKTFQKILEELKNYLCKDGVEN